jgi:hypothetical protein
MELVTTLASTPLLVSVRPHEQLCCAQFVIMTWQPQPQSLFHGEKVLEVPFVSQEQFSCVQRAVSNFPADTSIACWSDSLKITRYPTRYEIVASNFDSYDSAKDKLELKRTCLYRYGSSRRNVPSSAVTFVTQVLAPHVRHQLHRDFRQSSHD